MLAGSARVTRRPDGASPTRPAMEESKPDVDDDEEAGLGRAGEEEDDAALAFLRASRFALSS